MNTSVKIEHEIQATSRGQLVVSVRNGVVTLEGHVEDAGSGQEIVAEACRVEGVLAVRDRLDCPPSHNEGT
ncbi:MAG TPA: BON domain-containing protein [Streptosporangiaceae bacterium]|nr:BON domain-containing protein [Streptosporangiaceae bacterium]